MKSLGLFSQLISVAVAVVIGYFYVQPTIIEIGVIQGDSSQYETERKKIEAINNQLAMNIATFESIPRIDKERLATYMPRSIDEVSVMRDISFIIELAAVTNTALSYDGPLANEKTIFSQDNDSDSSSLGQQAASPHSFTVGVQGTYAEVKEFLRLLEQNEYPLEVHNLSLETTEAGGMIAVMKLVTYLDELILVTPN
jgi:hypothetical protein